MIFEGFLEPGSSPKIEFENHRCLTIFLLDFVVSFDYVLQTAFFAQSLKILIFLKENHYFSIISILAQGHKSARRTISWRLETNMKIVGKTYIFQLEIFAKSN